MDPADARTTPEMLAAAVEAFPAREAIVDGDTRITYEDLGRRAGDFARAVVSAGIAHGDRVAIWAPNMWEWIVAALGVHAAGGVLVPINTRYKGHEAAFVIERSRARMLVTVGDFLGADYTAMLRDSGVTLPHLECIVVVRGDAADGTQSWNAFVESADPHATLPPVAPGDLSDIMFTSGTTGTPKGVMCSHEQTMRVFATWSEFVGLGAHDRYLIVNPFFHTFGYKAGFLAALMRGATIVPHAVFDPGAVMERVSAERITVLPGPPTLYHSLLEHPGRAHADLSSLRLAVTGAAVVPVELIRRMRDELTFDTILTAYGLTESTGTATMCRPDDDPETIATTSGCAIPDTEVRVVDEHGAECARGTPGEIVIRGYHVMRGYFEEPEQTAEAIDPDGWLHTGDVGVMDERGYVRITDRLKDMLVVGGFNVYPAEVEAELIRHPSIAQAAVVGIPDARLGEVPVAFVVARDGHTIEPGEVLAWAKDRVANFKAPRRVETLDALPVNASGKVLKYELRARAGGVR